mmetsp:Transcript_22367/g.51497  ORF Transcript_22367/g.51497 Transcript_22367/m.51497 type:complete len:431 (-) Transcript_22367:84-1376(-)
MLAIVVASLSLSSASNAEFSQRQRVAAGDWTRSPTLMALRGGAAAVQLEEGRAVATKGAAAPNGLPSRSFGYTLCAAIVAVWLCVSTAFFSLSEGWPLGQSFFYSVDTGMSIGFGAVAEAHSRTKLFTIGHVLLGASAVGGAIGIFADSVLSASTRTQSSTYSLAAIEAAFGRADTDNSGTLSALELRDALLGLGLKLSHDELEAAIRRFDCNSDGHVQAAEFLAAVTPHLNANASVEAAIAAAAQQRSRGRLSVIARLLREQRLVLLWAVWIGAGIAWGMRCEGWDLVTAAYFAVGGLATGGLQAPSLSRDGTLPASSALFVGFYCLSGIPIFALTLGQYANVLVQRLISARERRAISRPISAEEYSFAEGVFSKADGRVDLSEFIALEMLRLGKVEMDTLELIKAEFNRLDEDKDGVLSLREVHRRAE